MARGNYDKVKQKAVNEIRFDIPNVPFGVGHCVYKLYYGDRYVINHGENLAGSLFLLQKGYAYHVAYNQTEGDDKKNKWFISLYRYIQARQGLKFRLEVVFEHTSPYEVLKACQLALNMAINDKKCLNSNLEPYIPQYRPKLKQYGTWVSRSHMLNFRKF